MIPGTKYICNDFVWEVLHVKSQRPNSPYTDTNNGEPRQRCRSLPLFPTSSELEDILHDGVGPLPDAKLNLSIPPYTNGINEEHRQRYRSPPLLPTSSELDVIINERVGPLLGAKLYLSLSPYTGANNGEPRQRRPSLHCLFGPWFLKRTTNLKLVRRLGNDAACFLYFYLICNRLLLGARGCENAQGMTAETCMMNSDTASSLNPAQTGQARHNEDPSVARDDGKPHENAIQNKSPDDVVAELESLLDNLVSGLGSLTVQNVIGPGNEEDKDGKDEVISGETAQEVDEKLPEKRPRRRKTPFQREFNKIRQRERRREKRKQKRHEKRSEEGLEDEDQDTVDFPFLWVLYLAHEKNGQLRKEFPKSVKQWIIPKSVKQWIDGTKGKQAVEEYMRHYDNREGLEFASSQELEDYLVVKRNELVGLRWRLVAVKKTEKHYEDRLQAVDAKLACMRYKSPEWFSTMNEERFQVVHRLAVVRHAAVVLPLLFARSRERFQELAAKANEGREIITLLEKEEDLRQQSNGQGKKVDLVTRSTRNMDTNLLSVTNAIPERLPVHFFRNSMANHQALSFDGLPLVWAPHCSKWDKYISFDPSIVSPSNWSPHIHLYFDPIGTSATHLLRCSRCLYLRAARSPQRQIYLWPRCCDRMWRSSDLASWQVWLQVSQPHRSCVAPSL
ncbi:hypothetical protein V8F20_004790 [Naviculisporaceae sp. PSN 640]